MVKGYKCHKHHFYILQLVEGDTKRKRRTDMPKTAFANLQSRLPSSDFKPVCNPCEHVSKSVHPRVPRTHAPGTRMP